MTRWGVFLLIAFIALGLSPVGLRTAMRVAVGLTACVILTVFVRYGAL